MSDLNLAGRYRQVAALLAGHDRLHDHLEEEGTDDLLRQNVGELLGLVGVPGIRGLVHVAAEMLAVQARIGLPLDAKGNWMASGDGTAYMALVSDVMDLHKLIALLAAWGGKVPEDHELAEAALERGDLF